MTSEILGYRSRRGLFIVELWYDETRPPSLRPDIIRYRQALNPPTPDCHKYHTLITDLPQENSVLVARMNKRTRYEVRRAEERDGLTIQVWDGKCPQFLSEFIAARSEFADYKKLSSLNEGYIEMLIAAGRFDISRVLNSSGDNLVYLAYYKDAYRARALYTATLLRKYDDNSTRALIGRANRWLHWQNILRFKEEGRLWYDGGGWYDGYENQEYLRVNQFKESFGGQIMVFYNADAFLSTKARLFTIAAKLIRRL